MSETATEIETTEGTEAPEVEAPADENRGNREAAKYRTRLRETETERDGLAERIQGLQTLELHRLAGKLLAAPEDIGLSGKALADYLTPEGWVDREAVTAAAASVIETRPGLAKNPVERLLDPSQGSGNTNGHIKSTPSWSALLA